MTTTQPFERRRFAVTVPYLTEAGLIAALFGGDMPTAGVEQYEIDPKGQTFSVFGTGLACSQVIHFMRSRGAVAEQISDICPLEVAA